MIDYVSLSLRRWSGTSNAQIRGHHAQHRKGTAAVEVALTLPLVVLLLLGTVEIGRAVAVQQTLTETARAGCRLYSVNASTQDEAQALIDQCLADANITGYTVTFDPTTSAEIDTQLEDVTVTVSVPYENVAWTVVSYMQGKTLSSACVMPADIRDYTGVDPIVPSYTDPPPDEPADEPAQDGSADGDDDDDD